MKVKTPFHELFKAVLQKTFVYLFRGEYPQKAAFILFFCQKRNYMKKVINFFDKEEQDETKKKDRFSFIIRNYLNNHRQEQIDKNLIEKL